LPTWSNIHVYPGGRTDPEILALEASSSEDWFAERYGGVPCPPKGRVFDEFSMPIHTGTDGFYELDPLEMVYLFVDPGYASAYAVEACQKRGDDIYVIDEVFERGFVTSDIIKICKSRPWWNRVVGGAIDIAAKQHQAMPAPAETWLAEGGVHLRSQKLQIKDGIELMKQFLVVNPKTQSPRLHINTRCRGLISELGGCPNPITNQSGVYTWKKDKDGQVIGETPEDKNNHACKAMAYGLVDLYGFMNLKKRPKIQFF
jgi:hypothetical protein